MPHHLFRHLWIFSIATALTLSISARADSDSAPTSADIKKAAASYDQGRERYREGRYVEAAEKFEAADAFAPSAGALRLAMMARKEAGQLARATSLAVLATQRHPGEEPLASEAQALLEEQEMSFARLSVTCDEPCELVLNNRLVHGRAATNRVLYVEPGLVELRASWPDERTRSQSLQTNAGDALDLAFFAPVVPVEVPVDEEPTAEQPPLEEEQWDEPAAAVDPSEESKGWHPAVFWTGTVLTVGAAGSSVALGLNALNNPGEDAIRDNCEAGDTSCPEWEKGRRNQLFANVAIGTTAAVGVFTIATGLWLTNWSKKKSDDAPEGFSVRPMLQIRRGAILGAEGVF